MSQAWEFTLIYNLKKLKYGYYLFEYNQLIMFIVSHCQGRTGAGELDDEDEEEDQHVEEQHDLVVLHGPNQSHHWDEQ